MVCAVNDEAFTVEVLRSIPVEPRLLPQAAVVVTGGQLTCRKYLGIFLTSWFLDAIPPTPVSQSLEIAIASAELASLFY